MNSKTVAFVTIAALALFVLFFKFLDRRTAKTYKPTKAEILEILDAVLSKRATYLQWDTFVCVPIRHDSLLESVRQQCVALEGDASLFARMSNEWQGDAVFSELGLQRIRQIRDLLADVRP